MGDPTTPSVVAISDLHVDRPENCELVEKLRPAHPGDWLIVAGDVADRFDDITWALTTLRQHFERVIWTPGNHELWTQPGAEDDLRGQGKYDALVAMCRRIDVDTPEDRYALWTGNGGPTVIAPLFVLYDYSFLAPGSTSAAQSLSAADRAGVVCSDEYFLHPDPYPTRAAWCADRLRYTEARLTALPRDASVVLVSHWPLIRAPTRALRHPEFAPWCGTVHTADWHQRYRAAAAVSGHLHIPSQMRVDGTQFLEVSMGYPKEWKRRGLPTPLTRHVLPLGRASVDD